LRLDQFLKWSRVILRRPLAKATCDAGRVHVNDSVARPGKEIAVGDVVTVDLPHRVMKFRVMVVPDRAPGKSEAGNLIEILENRKKDPDA
jgi:ribosomal 50S subunit-recycling heat shock protein